MMNNTSPNSKEIRFSIFNIVFDLALLTVVLILANGILRYVLLLFLLSFVLISFIQIYYINACNKNPDEKKFIRKLKLTNVFYSCLYGAFLLYIYRYNMKNNTMRSVVNGISAIMIIIIIVYFLYGIHRCFKE